MPNTHQITIECASHAQRVVETWRQYNVVRSQHRHYFWYSSDYSAWWPSTHLLGIAKGNVTEAVEF